MYVRGPGIPEVETRPHLTANTDIAPTFADLAGIAPPGYVDGRSLTPVLSEEPPDSTDWRQAVLLEGWKFEQAGTDYMVPTYKGLRTRDVTYVEYGLGDREIYDMETDPHQLNNRYGDANPARIRQLEGWLEELRRCRGQGRREAEK